MRYKLFGRSGLRVSEVSCGTMNFGQPEWGVDAASSHAVLDAYAMAGGNFIDTAHAYANGESERIIGDFIAADRDHFIVASKYTPSYGNDILKSGNSRRTMMRMVDESLRRLKTDYIDLYYLHVWDFTTPIDEVMRGLEDLVRMGKVVYVASSDMPAWQVSRANMLADLRGWAPFTGIQFEYNLARRTPERDLLPMARELDLGMVAWSPLAGGVLARPADDTRDNVRGRAISQHDRNVAKVVHAVAREQGLQPGQVALAALRQLKGSERVIPLIGAGSPEQMRENLSFLTVTLDTDTLDRIDAATAIDRGFPHEFLESPYMRQLVTSGHDAVLDNHRRRI